MSMRIRKKTLLRSEFSVNFAHVLRFYKSFSHIFIVTAILKRLSSQNLLSVLILQFESDKDTVLINSLDFGASDQDLVMKSIQTLFIRHLFTRRTTVLLSVRHIACRLVWSRSLCYSYVLIISEYVELTCNS